AGGRSPAAVRGRRQPAATGVAGQGARRLHRAPRELIVGAAAARRPFLAWGSVFVSRCSRRRVGGLSRRVRLLRRCSRRRVGGLSRRIRLLRRCSWRRRSIGGAQPRPLDEPPRLLIRPQQGVSVLGSVLEAALFELERRPIKLVDQFWVPLPQPFRGQKLSRQTLEPRDEAAVIGLHAAIPLLIRIVVIPSRAIAAPIAFSASFSRCGAAARQRPFRSSRRREGLRAERIAAIRSAPPARASGSQPLRMRPLPMDRALPPPTAWPQWPVGGSTLPVHP